MNWAGPLFIPPTEDHDGAQIDLLLDRPDATVNLCEMKFYAEPFTLTKEEATELLRKKQLVRTHFRGRKRVQLTLVTNYPPVENKWLREVVDGVVTLGELLAEL